MSTLSKLELAAVVATALAHLLTWRWPAVHAAVVILVMVGWGGWLGVRCRRDAELRRAVGLRRAGLGRTLVLTLPPAVLTVVALAAWGSVHGTLSLPWTLAILLVTYPLWGLVQQLLVQGVLVRHLAALPALVGRPYVAVLAGGLLFGVVHWPFPELMVATAVMGTVFGWVWLRHRNLWPLGLLHGWLGAAFFLWVMDADPMAAALAEVGVEQPADFGEVLRLR